jgi:hypothetical protein
MSRHAKLALLAAGAFFFTLLPTGTPSAGRPAPRTLITESGRIHAFAQDSGAVAWIGHDYAVHVRRLAARRGAVVGNANDGYTHMPWPLALAGTQALWASYDAGNFIYTHIHTASSTLRDRVVFDLSYMRGPADGSWLGGMAGDGSTLVFGSILQRCDVEWSCRRIDVEGAVKRVNTAAADVAGLPSPFLLATSSGRIALVPAKTPRLFPDIGPPRAAEYAPVQVFDASGHLISSFAPDGTPRAVALAWPKLALLFEFVDGGRRIELRDARSGGYWNVGGEASFARVPPTVGRVAVGIPGAVYAIGNAVYVLRGQKPQLVARAGGAPIGLSIEGRRIAWAENVHGKGRIRALAVSG